MKNFIGIMCLLSSLCSCTPLDEELAGEFGTDYTSQLLWIGDTAKFTLSDKEGLRLNDKEKAAGHASLATPSERVRGTRWECRIRLMFRPSLNNYARFYLVSSSDKLSGSVDGYFIQLGGKEDAVALYRQTGDKVQVLAVGRALGKGINSVDVSIRVECDDNGYWTFWTRLKDESEYVLEKQIWDTSFITSAYAGVSCVYTASRSNGFVFNQIRISDGVETHTEPKPEKPAEPEEPEQPNEVWGKSMVFTEVMYHHAADGAEYVEIFNDSEEVVSLAGMQLEKCKPDGTAMVGGTILLANPKSSPAGVVPGSYTCFTLSAKGVQKKHQVSGENIVELSNFFSLSNQGGFLVLRAKGGKELDWCYFGNDAHTNDAKDRVGVSLEKRLPKLASDKRANWASSQHPSGGTPGMPNRSTGN